MSARTAGVAASAAALTLVLSRLAPDGDHLRRGFELYAADARAGLSALAWEASTLPGSIGSPVAALSAALGALGGSAGALLVLVVVSIGAAMAHRTLGRSRPAVRQPGTASDPARVELARQLAARGRPGGDIARETRLSRDAVSLVARHAPRPDGIAASGRTFRADPASRSAAASWAAPSRWLSHNGLRRRIGAGAAGTAVALAGRATSPERTR